MMMASPSITDAPQDEFGIRDTWTGPWALSARFRLAVRAVGIALWTGALFLVWGLGALPCALTSRWFASWRARVVQLWACGMCRLLGIHRIVEGTVPVPPFLLASNHLSYVDILVLAASVRGVFVAKREVQGWPGIGFLATVFGTIYLDRARKRDAVRVLDHIDRSIEQGIGVVLFPEGTSSPGDQVYPFHSALFEWAARRTFPVHAVTLSYQTEPPDPPAHLAICWWGSMTFVPHLARLVSLRGGRALVRFGPDPVRGDHRRDLARRLEHAVTDQFTPVVQPEPL